jgi:glycosyltransferase involved in cell wall biosynthesis
MADAYHLFHFDRGWFFDLIGQHFQVVESLETASGCHQCFCALAKRAPCVALPEKVALPIAAPSAPAAQDLAPERRRVEAAVWLREFRKRHGRAPRILHVGNIANNAYINAKILNEEGFDCDVLCHDYYHIMGCPEWHDAEIDGAVADQNRPDWTRVDLKGYRRPRWFVQGPLFECIAYLSAKRRGRRLRQALVWHLLSGQNRTSKWAAPAAWMWKAWRFAGRKASFLWRRLRRRFRGWVLLVAMLLWALATATRAIPWKVAAALLTAMLLFRYAPWCVKRLRRLIAVKLLGHDASPSARLDARIQELIDEFARRFPLRADRLTREDFSGYAISARAWRQLFAHYDAIVAYATTGILPLLAEKRPYVAYEHGTIRSIPAEPTAQGRLCALTYALADAIYMTNADSMKQAAALQADPGRIVYGIHGFDEAVVRRWSGGAPADAPGGGRPDPRFGVAPDVKVFFAPARHQWSGGDPGMFKGNDKIIRAAAMLARRRPEPFVVIFIDWGQEVELSRRLIDELALGDRCRWVAPLHKQDLWRAYGAVDCVLDQFELACIGGIAMEAIAADHAAVVTRLDDHVMAAFFGETIPLFNCATAEEIAAAMEAVLRDLPECRQRTRAAYQWMSRHHSRQTVVETTIRALKRAGL